MSQGEDAYERLGLEKPAKRWDPNDPSCEPLEVLRDKADKAEAGRYAALWRENARAAVVKEQEAKDRQDEVEEILKQQGGRLAKPPKSYVTREEMEEVKRLQDTDPDKAKALLEKLRRKEVLEFQKQKQGAKFGFGMEVMCDNCKKFHLVIQRCARCRMAWYCSQQCQKADWPTHKHVCSEEEKKRIRSESQPGTPVGTPATTPQQMRAFTAPGAAAAAAAPTTAGAEPKKASSKPKKKKEVVIKTGSQDPKELEPDMEQLEAAQEEMLGRVINKVGAWPWVCVAHAKGTAEHEAIYGEGEARVRQHVRANARRHRVHVAVVPLGRTVPSGRTRQGQNGA